MSIGIGITTRNRPHVLEVALQHFEHFSTKDAKYVVVEDKGYEHKSSSSVISKFENAIDLKYVRPKRRLGIAGAKNTCIHYLSDCEDVFLFDDDAWPKAFNWAELWIEVEKANQVDHSMFICDSYKYSKSPPFFHVAQTIGEEPYLMDAWNACMGLALHFSRECLNALGGYDTESALNYYGYEHAQMSVRAAQAGFTKGHRYLAPRNITDWIYSVDVTHNIFNEPIPLTGERLSGFQSSVTDFEMNSASKNAGMMTNPQIHIPINQSLIP